MDMEFLGEGVVLYIDQVAREQQGRYDPFRVLDQVASMQEQFPVRHSLLPFLAEMCAHDLIIGMDQTAYEQVRRNRALPMSQQTPTESILEGLLEKGFLRRVQYKDRLVYFPSERMLQ